MPFSWMAAAAGRGDSTAIPSLHRFLKLTLSLSPSADRRQPCCLLHQVSGVQASDACPVHLCTAAFTLASPVSKGAASPQPALTLPPAPLFLAPPRLCLIIYFPSLLLSAKSLPFSGSFPFFPPKSQQNYQYELA